MLFFSELTYKAPFFGVIFSLVLLTGLYEIGRILSKNKLIFRVLSNVSEIKYQRIILAVNTILLIFFPLILYFKTIYLIHLIGLLIFVFGFYGVINFLLKIKKLNLKKLFIFKNLKISDEIVVYIAILGLFILSLAPNTHADTLGYHFTIAKNLLEGVFPMDITHVHTFLGGAGEIMIAIGLLFGSDQFGNLIQFSGLVSIFGIFKNIINKDKFYFLLLSITSPIILFLCSTSKPQLFHICSIALVFSLNFLVDTNKLKKNEKIIKDFISLSILLVAINSKFNFLLSGSLIGLYIFYNAFKNKNIKYLLVSFFTLFIFFNFPLIYLKFKFFGGNILQYFYSPLPLHITGMSEFKTSLTQFGKESSFLKIFIPTNMKQFTNSVGISFIYLFFLNYKNNKSKIVAFLILVYSIMTFNYGQFIGRSFLEPLLMVTLICAKYGTAYKIVFFKYICRVQSYFVILLIFFGIYILFPGTLSSSLKDKVLSKHAMGYSLYKWANEKLSHDDVVFSYHRSISFGKSKYIAMDFIPFVNLKDKKSYLYVEKIKSKNPKFYLTYSFANENPNLSVFKHCLGKLLYYGKNIGHKEARNPYNIGNFYNGFIYEFKIDEFPNCVLKPSEIK